METNKSNKFCFICQEDAVEKNQIFFTCDHSFCLKCYPYLLINLLSSNGINEKLFENLQREILCPICSLGKAQFSFKPLYEEFFHDKSNSKEGNLKESKKLCSYCDEVAKEWFCVECNDGFCITCLEAIHQVKKFQNHRITTLDDYREIIELDCTSLPMKKQDFKCKCSANQTLSHFCYGCQKAFCQSCLETEHNGHLVVLLENPDFEKWRNEKNLNLKINEWKEICLGFQEQFLAKLERERDIFNKEFEKIMDEIIKKLKSSQKNCNEKIIEETNFLKSQMNLFGSCLSHIEQDVDEIIKLHPNKQFHIIKILNEIKIEKLENTNYQCSFQEILQKIQEIKIPIAEKIEFPLISENDEKKRLIVKKSDVNVIKLEKEVCLKEIPSSVNPIYLLKEPELVIQEKSFYCRWNKSSVSCNFQIENESFLAWAGYNKASDGKKTYPLILYNLFEAKTITLEPDNKSAITVVSTYPKDKNIKKWLFCANQIGVVKIYRISNDKSFRLESQISTNLGKPILAAMIFKDQFQELINPMVSNDMESTIIKDSDCFMILTLWDAELPILLYKNIRTERNEERWELFRKIQNPLNRFCFTINFYYDEISNKTRFFFGFCSSFISIYDFANDKWEQTEFVTKNVVYSINFFFKNIKTSEKDSFFIYTHAQNIIIGNLETKKILRSVELPNVTCICDCCVWDSTGGTYLLVATNNLNSIQIIDLETLSVVFVKNLDKFPINLTKVLNGDDDPKCTNTREMLSCFLEYGDNSSISIFDLKEQIK